MGGGQQSAGPTTSNSSTIQIPQWLDSAAQGAVGTAQDLSQRPYTPYTGQINAGTNADTQQAYQQVRDMQGAANPAFDASSAIYTGLLGQAAPITARAVNDNTNTLYGNYQSQVMDPATSLLGKYASQGRRPRGRWHPTPSS